MSTNTDVGTVLMMRHGSEQDRACDQTSGIAWGVSRSGTGAGGDVEGCRICSRERQAAIHLDRHPAHSAQPFYIRTKHRPSSSRPVVHASDINAANCDDLSHPNWTSQPQVAHMVR